MSDLKKKWIESTMMAPQFSCGRLDMQSWDASDGVQEKYVYVEGEDERYQIKGRYCDEIAFAAAHYQEAMIKIKRLDEEFTDIVEALGMLSDQPTHAEVLSAIKQLRSDLDKAFWVLPSREGTNVPPSLWAEAFPSIEGIKADE